MNILVSESIPGRGAALSIMASLEKAGIRDIQLFFDESIIPNGMWAVVQVNRRNSNILMPDSYKEQEPYILWWCKDEQTGKFREPNDEDLNNIITVVKRAPAIWEQGEKRADKFDELDAKKDQAHHQKLKDTVHDIATPLKKALQKGNL